MNALLSFVYSILGKDISGALQGVGLDPQVGFLHADRPGAIVWRRIFWKSSVRGGQTGWCCR